jgi:hypothetical protein
VPDAHALGRANVARDAVEKLYSSDTKGDIIGFNPPKNLVLNCLARVLLKVWVRVQLDWKRVVRARDRGEKIMSDEQNTRGTEITSRRDLVKKSAQVAVTAPAVAMLLNASTKQAFAQVNPYQASNLHILDDFTFGNTHEDVDALATHSNFGAGFNNLPLLDDHV